MKRYKLSKINKPDKFCSKYKDYFLIEDDNGRTLRSIADDLYELLIMVVGYNTLLDCVNYEEIKNKNKNEQGNEGSNFV